MADFREKRAFIKFRFKLEKTATKYYELLKTAFGEPKLNPGNGNFRGLLDRIDKTSEKQHQANVDYFFDQKRIVHKEIVTPGQAINPAFYVEVLKRLLENVRRKRPDQ